jgi:hypothetical protein
VIHTFVFLKKKNTPRHPWLMLVILATQETEIRGLLFKASPDKYFM